MGLEDWKHLIPRAAHLYMRIMNYIYTILKLIKEIIIYIMSIDINTCYIYMRSIKIIKTKQKNT